MSDYEESIGHILDSEYGTPETRERRLKGQTMQAIGAIADALNRIADALEKKGGAHENSSKV